MIRFLAGVAVGAIAVVLGYLWLVFRPIRVGLSPAHRRALDADQWPTS